MLPAELHRHLGAHDVPATLAQTRQLLAHVLAEGRDDLDLPTPLPRAVRAGVERTTVRQPLTLVERAADPVDGFVKYLFRSPDGALSEAVRIPLHRPGRYSVCLSSQVGCAFRCAFCATGRMGLGRNLETWEMVAAFRAAAADIALGRASGAVFMGQGEPLANYDAVIAAARVLSDPCGMRVAQKSISISTVGLVPQIERYTREGHRFRLIVSLCSTVPERRRRLLPVAGRVPIEDLAHAVRAHQAARGGRATLAWVLVAGLNGDETEVDGLERLFGSVPFIVNLIDVNDPRPDGFGRASDEERRRFVAALQRLKVPIVRRYSGGGTREAACGMLRNARLRPAGEAERG
jgi:23S rRNA (adenine2503-C2)-methyltransferase